MHQCPYCENTYDSYNGLAKHTSRTHKIPKEELAIKVFHNDEVPKCKCGCGNPLNYMPKLKDSGYYGSYLRGHIARIKNNWGHNQTAIDKSSKTRREQFKNGERKVWNDGLTKDTDNRILEYSNKGSITINNNPTEIQRRSQWLSNARNNNPKFKSKFGKDSANWKGGTSSINNLIRANKRLYTEWIYPILREQNFKCQQCDSTKELEVHHNDETMAQILSKFVNKEDEYSWDEKHAIMNEVIDYHINGNVNGEVLCKSCHQKHHPSYNI